MIYSKGHNFVKNVGEVMVLLTDGVCVSGSAHATNGGNGRMMSTAGLELPYPRVFQAKFREGKVM